MNTIKFFNPSWEKFHHDTRAMASLLMPADQWKGIIAITRGGLIPAAIIARELGIRLIDTICVASYDHTEQRSINILKHTESGDGEGMLLVDDLVDTGNTAVAVRKLLPKAHFVTIYAKPAGRPFVDQFITEIEQDIWINFPWDTGLDFKEPLVS